MEVTAAGEGDFVIAFYNPVSKKRTQLAWARDRLLEYRPASTPVILATNLGREGELIRIVPLGALNVDDVDMLTVVVVGSSNSSTVATGDGYDTNINAWSLSLVVPSFDVTGFDDVAAGDRWMEHIPGLLSATGTYGGFSDDAALVIPPQTHTACTFALDGTNSYTCAAITTGPAITQNVAAVGTVSYPFRVNGDVTAVGSLLFAAAAIARPAAGSLVLTATDDGA